jgi:hypothetical protein
MRFATRFVRLAGLGLALLCMGTPRAAGAATIPANPSDYRAKLSTLTPGDTLALAAGTYTRLTLDTIQGTPSAWITITGPSSGPAAVIEGESCCNTVQLYGSSYIVVRNLTIDGKGLDVDGINAKDQISHHVVIENCTLINLGANQQIVGINVKSTAWGWVIRNNSILEAGTGIYLGNSDGSSPFIGGVIEGNFIRNPIGYCMEIKFQNPYTLQTGMPSGPNRTIIRNNVFIKDDRPSPDGDRPNLLVDPFPDTGPGSSDLYEIYGNFLFHNPRESLLQATGRLSVHDNVFVDAGSQQASIYLTDHNGALKLANVYNNTIYSGYDGIQFASPPRTAGRVVGNLVFSTAPIGLCGSCSGVTVSGNVTDASASAGRYVVRPSLTLGSMDFYPRSDCPGCQGTPLDLSAFSGETDYAYDFNGTSKGGFAFRGAYAGAGVNPGWTLSSGPKVGGPSSSGSGSADSIPPAAAADLRTR